MARFSGPLQIVGILERDQSPSRVQYRLSWRGRLVTTAFMLPGIASGMLSLFLPNSDQGGAFSLSVVTFYVGGFTVLTGPVWTLIYAHWMPSLRRYPDLAEWDLGLPRAWLPALVEWILVGGNVVAAAWFGLLVSHLWVELIPSGLYLAAAATHTGLAVTRRR
jgi:hypothetical protein